MRNKKGVSPLLAAVLLVAFAVALGAIVSNYVIKQAKQFNPEVIAEQSVFCESVSLGYSVPDPDNLRVNNIDIGGRTVRVFGDITLINRGAFSIHQLIITAPGVQSRPYVIYDEEGNAASIKPGADNKYNISISLGASSDTEIKIIPVIKDPEKNQFVRCPDRQVVIDYEQLCVEVKGEPC